MPSWQTVLRSRKRRKLKKSCTLFASRITSTHSRPLPPILRPYDSDNGLQKRKHHPPSLHLQELASALHLSRILPCKITMSRPSPPRRPSQGKARSKLKPKVQASALLVFRQSQARRTAPM